MVVMFYDILDYIFVWISIVDSWNRLSKFFYNEMICCNNEIYEMIYLIYNLWDNLLYDLCDKKLYVGDIKLL